MYPKHDMHIACISSHIQSIMSHNRGISLDIILFNTLSILLKSYNEKSIMKNFIREIVLCLCIYMRIIYASYIVPVVHCTLYTAGVMYRTLIDVHRSLESVLYTLNVVRRTSYVVRCLIHTKS